MVAIGKRSGENHAPRDRKSLDEVLRVIE